MTIPITALSMSLLVLGYMPLSSQLLEKKGEISGLSATRNFIYIDDICSDDEGNLYVSDSGRNEILVFNRDNVLSGTLGSEGQGSGEFLGLPGRAPILLFHGGNRFLYVTDLGNSRLTVFEKGRFVFEYDLPKAYMNRIVGDDLGRFYIIDNANERMIIRKSLRSVKESPFFERRYHYSYPISPPPWKHRSISRDEVQIELEKPAKLDVIVFSNHSLRSFRYEGLHMKQVMLVQQKDFLDDFSSRLAKSIKSNSFINPLRFHVDFKGNSCYAYFNSGKGQDHFLVYSQEGEFIGTLFIPRQTSRTFCFNSQGTLFIVENSTKIGLYDYPAVLSALTNVRRAY